jgi:beta-lactamase superfamily II metal-dependent hydrolase
VCDETAVRGPSEKMTLGVAMKVLTCFLTLLLTPAVGFALEAGPNDAYVRVVDVGPGLCIVVKVPGPRHLVYDAGHWTGKHCVEAVREIVGSGEIDLMIFSHSDSDHLGNAPDILEEYRVRYIIRAGDLRTTTTTWTTTNEAIAEAVKKGATVVNFLTAAFVPGTRIPLGDAVVTIVAGWSEWTEPGPTASERLNALSVVAQLTYRGRSVLFTGDTVGRRRGDPPAACKDAEAKMVQNHQTGQVSLKSDVIIAPHHGGDNGSSTCFVDAVAPTFVVFSAGSQHQHPSKGAAERYLAHGVQLQNMFRTDRGDDEDGPFEWKAGSIAGCQDGRGDDDVEIVIRGSGSLEVAYRHSGDGC